MYNRLIALADKLPGQKLMFIGDMVADVYLEGKIARISREAPVLILEHTGETIVPGGAANAVHNAAALGGSALAGGVIGDDQRAQELKRILAARQIDVSGLMVDPDWTTITKTRVMAGGKATVRQQVVRIDRVPEGNMTEATENCLLNWIDSRLAEVAAIVMCDYGSRTISLAIRQRVIDAAAQRGIPCMIDSRYDILSYPGVTLVKQSETEAVAALGWKQLDTPTIEAAGQEILRRLGARAVLITRGPEGMSLFEQGGKISHIPVTNRTDVYDVSGAGDTVVATMMLAVAAGASYRDAAVLANFAAGVVVKKPGTSTTSLAELKTAIGEYHESD